jgi:hypothetical protein
MGTNAECIYKNCGERLINEIERAYAGANGNPEIWKRNKVAVIFIGLFLN